MRLEIGRIYVKDGYREFEVLDLPLLGRRVALGFRAEAV